MDKKLARILAKHEVGWWMGHHRKNFEKARKDMVEEYILLFNLPREKAERSVEFRIEAAKMHDIAEKYEDEGNSEEAEKYWKKVEELLAKHFEVM